MNLTNETIQQTYGNLLTIGDTAGSPTQGTVQNGSGQDVTKLTLNELQVNKLVQTQATIAASGTSLAGATLLTAGVNLVTSADSNNIAVKLPQPELGLVINVVNTSERDISVFPYAVTDSVLGLPAGDAYVVSPNGLMYQFICTQNPSVGVWSVLSPFNGTSATIVSDVTMSIDSNSPTDGNSKFLGSPYGVSANVEQIYANGQVVHRELVLGNNGNKHILDMSKFNGYNEFRIKRVVVETNIPAGDLSTLASSQFSSTLMGLTSQQFTTLGVSFTSAIWDDTVTGSIQQYSVNDMFKQWNVLYTAAYYNALQGNGPFPSDPLQGQFTHFIASPQSFAYDVNSSNNRYQKYELNGPSEVFLGYANWQKIFDVNNNPVRYIGLDLTYGDSNNPYTGFPSGFEFKARVLVEWEVR